MYFLFYRWDYSTKFVLYCFLTFFFSFCAGKKLQCLILFRLFLVSLNCFDLIQFFKYKNTFFFFDIFKNISSSNQTHEIRKEKRLHLNIEVGRNKKKKLKVWDFKRNASRKQNSFCTGPKSFVNAGEIQKISIRS